MLLCECGDKARWSKDDSYFDVGKYNMAIFEGMSTIEKEELIVSLAALLCADAKVEVSVEICLAA